MSHPKIAGYTLIVTLIAVTCMASLNFLLKQPTTPPPRMLFIGDGASESWDRVEAGALAAARDFGVSVLFETPAPGTSPIDQQTAVVRKINLADYGGVAFCPADSASQLELINSLAEQTNLVTVGNDHDQSNRLCHVGYCPHGAGRMAAWLARAELPHDGKVVLLSSANTDNSDVAQRLAGFNEAWAEAEINERSHRFTITSISIDSANITSSANGLPAILTDSQLTIVIAFDTAAAEAAIKSLTAQLRTTRVPIIAFDPSACVFDAVDDGHVDLAIYYDPYRKGYEAIERLALYCDDNVARPRPGYGNVPLVGEVVRKSNVDDFRKRTKLQPVRQRLADHRIFAASSLE